MKNFLNVCTYDMGAHLYRYGSLCHFHLRPVSEENYQAAEERVVRILTSSALFSFDVFCLQEVVKEDRPLIQALKERDFSFVYSGSEENPSRDCAIALSSRFDEIVNYSIQVPIEYKDREVPIHNYQVAIASARDTLYDQRYTFVSASIPTFVYKTILELSRSSEESQISFLQRLVSPGDRVCLAIADKLSQISGDVLQVMGANLGATPEVWKPRFDIFSGRDFVIHQPNEPTQIRTVALVDEMPLVASDFLLTKVKDPSHCSYVSSEIHVHPEITFDSVHTNSSPYRPVMLSLGAAPKSLHSLRLGEVESPI